MKHIHGLLREGPAQLGGTRQAVVWALLCASRPVRQPPRCGAGSTTIAREIVGANFPVNRRREAFCHATCVTLVLICVFSRNL